MPHSANNCYIWNTPVLTAASLRPGTRSRWIDDSPRAGGSYDTDDIFDESIMIQFTESEKALLTSWLIDQRRQGIRYPRITTFSVSSLVASLKPLQIEERANRLLTLLAVQTERVGQLVTIALPYEDSIDPNRYGTLDDVPDSVCNLWRAMAWSESTTIGEVDFLIDYLTERGWLNRNHRRQPESVLVTIDGYAHIEDSRANLDRSQAFVAMWFADDMDDAFGQGIQPAIEDAGYTAMRIDRKEHINKVDDEIIAEIRRSRFLVADFSQGNDGARGGVYFEAGFALGLGIPVIYTCRKSDIDKLHFDTRQYNHIVWESPEDLRTALKNRILAVIGEGPNTR